MKLLKHYCAPLIAATCAVVLLAGCGKPADATSATAKPKTIRLAYVNWAEGVAVTHLLEALLGDMGYNVEATMADAAPVYTSVADGKQDVIVEAWLPTTHKSYFAQYGSRLELISTWFDKTQLGIVVPKYVEIDSIEQMVETADQFKGKIIGIDAGAAIMGLTAKVIEDYELDNFELVGSSDPAMTAALKGAIDKKEWIAVTGWSPHWKFSRYDLKFLKDPKKIYGGSEFVQSLGRLGFSEDFPEAAALFKRMKFNMEQIGSLMDCMEHASVSEEAAIRDWISKNQTLVDGWLGK